MPQNEDILVTMARDTDWLRSEVKRYVLTGYEDEPSVQIKRPLPVPLCVLGVKQEIAGK